MLGGSEEEEVAVPVTSLVVLEMTSGFNELREGGAAGAVVVREKGCREREREAAEEVVGAFNVVSIESLEPRGLCLFEGERVILEKKEVGPVVSTVVTPELDDVEGLRALRWEEADSTMTRPRNRNTKMTQSPTEPASPASWVSVSV